MTLQRKGQLARSPIARKRLDGGTFVYRPDPSQPMTRGEG